MKPIGRHAAVGVLALAFVLLEAVPAGGDPETARNEGCQGETFRVAIDRHVHGKYGINEVSEISPTHATNVISDYDLTMRGTYVRELHDGKLQWVSRTIEWSGQSRVVLFGCYLDAGEAGGHLELGPTDGPVDTMTPWQRDQIKWHAQPEKKFGGSCFLFAPGGGTPLRFPEIRAMGDKLRSTSSSSFLETLLQHFSAVDPDGSRYSETVEQRGNEKVSISANPEEIVPNQSGTGSNETNWVPKNPDEATSQLTVRATCDGARLKDRRIELRIHVQPRSGYHEHVLNRQRGKLADGKNEATDCGVETGGVEYLDPYCITVKTDADGEAKVKFKSPLTGSVDHTEKGSGPYMSGIAGDYKITANDAQFTEVRADTTVHAKVTPKLEPATFNTHLTGTGASPAHPDGHYGTHGTVTAFSSLAESFYNRQKDHNTALAACKAALKGTWAGLSEWPIVPLSVNDIALQDGGIFDLDKDWQPSHYTHSKGQGGDFDRFGASDPKTWEDPDILRVDCDAKCICQPAVTIIWYMQVLIELGKVYGKWDCSDLGTSGYYPVFNPDACKTGEIPTGKFAAPLVMAPKQGPPGPAALYFPPKLHLHVED